MIFQMELFFTFIILFFFFFTCTKSTVLSLYWVLTCAGFCCCAIYEYNYPCFYWLIYMSNSYYCSRLLENSTVLYAMSSVAECVPCKSTWKTSIQVRKLCSFWTSSDGDIMWGSANNNSSFSPISSPFGGL